MPSNDHLHCFPQAIAALFRGPHQPTAAWREQAESEKARHAANPPADSFYLELKLGPPLQIPWSCNTRALLGCRGLTYESLIERVHPGYGNVFLNFSLAFQQLLLKHKDIIAQQPIACNLMMPLRHDNGRYFWFNQFSKPSGLAENLCLTHQLNTYRLIGEYQGTMLLSRPNVLLQSEAAPDIQKEFQQLAGKAALERMFNLRLEKHGNLHPVHQRILYAWWKVYAKLGPAGTNHNKVAANLPFQPNTLKKHVQAILEAARQVFPLYPIKDMNDLARLLVGLFGAEGHQAVKELAPQGSICA